MRLAARLGQLFLRSTLRCLPAVLNVPLGRMEVILHPGAGGLRLKALHTQTQKEWLNADDRQDASEEALFIGIILHPWTTGSVGRRVS
jgi:hypothetical protein